MTPPIRSAVITALNQGQPPESLAVYSRWWQLETWLRQLAYVELRALKGQRWQDEVRDSLGRQAQDAAYRHMTTADTDNPLAYFDYSQLIQLIDRHWSLFEPSLLTRTVWAGRHEELTRIRHRIAHMRRPHADDLSRIEQTLRDLERGTFIALASYNRQHVPDKDRYSDGVTRGWLRGDHPTAQRLIKHADRQYETRLLLRVSRRPWLARWPAGIAGSAGVLWHAHFIMRGRYVDARELWYDSALYRVRELLVHMLADSPWHVCFTFAAIDDDQAIADAIGEAFDALLTISHYAQLSDRQVTRWERFATSTDHRVLHGSGWNVVDETTVPITNFGAGGGVLSAPDW